MSDNNILIGKYVVMFIILTGVGILYEKYKKHNKSIDVKNDYKLIQRYLLNEDALPLGLNKKPILWIHIDREKNARYWDSFYSRGNDCLNQPYINLLVKNIINYCDKSFHITLIDDDSFKALLPDWNLDLSRLSDPVKSNYRLLGKLKMLEHYGGVFIPPSLCVERDILHLYNKGIANNGAFVGEFVNNNISSKFNKFYPDTKLIGGEKGSDAIKEMIKYIENIAKYNYTDEVQFSGEIGAWCLNQVSQGKMGLIDGTMIGTKTVQNNPITIDDLFSSNYIHLNEYRIGIYIPENDVLHRTKYNWFPRMSEKQILNGNFFLAKAILLSVGQHNNTGGLLKI